jgi:CheY-like chemotaxis protein
MKYLVVEDDKNFQEIVGEVIKKQGDEITFATSFQEAEKLLEEKKFDRVITDLFFPESEKEAIGEIGRKLITFLQDMAWLPDQPKTCSFDDPHAPLGLRIFGKAYSKKIPAIIASRGDRHRDSLGFVRYKVEAAGRFTFYPLLACGGFEKWSAEEWESAINKFESIGEIASEEIPKIVPATRKIIFGF